MPSVLKYFDDSAEIQSYDYANDFSVELKKKVRQEEFNDDENGEKHEITDGEYREDQTDSEDDNDDTQKSDVLKEAEEIIAEAKKKADDIIAKAEKEAEKIKKEAAEEGQKDGYEQGYDDGMRISAEECEKKLQDEMTSFQNEFQSFLNDAEQKRNELIYKYRDELKDLSVAVAEKVIQVSLKSSGQVISKMIIAATEKLKSKAWAKIYISKSDAELMVEGDINLLKSLSHVSEHIKIVAMENERHGTCIIELPDEIIDASVDTQVENIKEILNNARL